MQTPLLPTSRKGVHCTKALRPSHALGAVRGAVQHPHCARLTYFLHPKLRKLNAVLITPQLMALTLPHLRRAQSISLREGNPLLLPTTTTICHPDRHLQPQPSPTATGTARNRMLCCSPVGDSNVMQCCAVHCIVLCCAEADCAVVWCGAQCQAVPGCSVYLCPNLGLCCPAYWFVRLSIYLGDFDQENLQLV